VTEPARLWTIIIGIGGGLMAIIWNRALARQLYTSRFAGKTDWRGRPLPRSLEQKLRFGYIGVGVLFLVNGLWALIHPWLMRSH
jgi:hypothetical protein